MIFSSGVCVVHVCVCVRARILSRFSCVRLSETTWTAWQAARLLCDNTGVGFPFLLQGISRTQGSNPYLLRLLPAGGCLAGEPPGNPSGKLPNPWRGSWELQIVNKLDRGVGTLGTHCCETGV